MPSKPTFSARFTSSRSSRRWPAISPCGCCPRTMRLSRIAPGSLLIPASCLSRSAPARAGVLVELEAHAAHDVRGLRELDIVVLDDLDAVAPRVEKIEEWALDHLGAGRLGAFLDARAVVDDKADMPPLDPGL